MEYIFCMFRVLTINISKIVPSGNGVLLRVFIIRVYILDIVGHTAALQVAHVGVIYINLGVYNFFLQCIQKSLKLHSSDWVKLKKISAIAFPLPSLNR